MKEKSRLLRTTNPYEKYRIISKLLSDYTSGSSSLALSSLAGTLFQNMWLCNIGRFGTDGTVEWEYHTDPEKLHFNDSVHRALLRSITTAYELRGYFIRELDLGPDTSGSLSAYPEITRMWVDFLQARPPEGMISSDYNKELEGEVYSVGAN